ncbi:MAG: SDR family NAD(P)-dependent oxidoreductase [Clostridia bacterium]|nr:SDR family NAD(P)-dependent oxidoreductase [Clostridia bacterium]
MSGILITGASRGVGRALAVACASSGLWPRIVITALRNEEGLRETARRVTEAGCPLCVPALGDVGDLAWVEKLRREIGPVETLVNNAAVSKIGLLTDLTPAEWDEVLRVNLTSLYNTCHTFVPDMVRAGQGRILNISSVWGLAGASCEVAYSASKGGVNAFTRALARELAPSHIQVNAAALGIVDTEMNRHLSDAEKAEICDQIPAGYIVSPEEAAQALLKLLTMPEYFNGEIVRLDGCWL